jgi:hypothetical protein
MKNRTINFTLALASLLSTLFVLEIGARVYKSEFEFKNFFAEHKTLLHSTYPAKYDAELGWTPEEGDYSENLWKTRITILADGIRSNGSNEDLDLDNNRPILAIGDSFTFGDQVSNNETWPAQLEEMSGRRVINGGVFGYGIDQAYLRMRMLAAKYKPGMIIFSFIPNDISRTEHSEMAGVPKPYFDLSQSGGLVLMKNHIRYSPSYPMDNIRKTIGYSFFAHKMLLKFYPEYWLHRPLTNKKVHSDGEKLAFLIFSEIGQFSKSNKIDMLILIQYTKDQFEKNITTVEHVISYIDHNPFIDHDHLKIVDLKFSLAELKNRDREKYESFFNGHMTKEGNVFVARILSDLITKTKKMHHKTNSAKLQINPTVTRNSELGTGL